MSESSFEAEPTIVNPIPDDLARAFVLPEWLREDVEMVALYDAIVSRLRREALGMPMSTVQQLLLERISFNYIVLKYKEEHNDFRRVNEQKDFNTWWLSMTAEFNKLLMANQDKLREAMMMEVQKVVLESVKLIVNDDDRRNVKRYLAEAFAQLDM
jgi:hypothetical protein